MIFIFQVWVSVPVLANARSQRCQEALVPSVVTYSSMISRPGSSCGDHRETLGKPWENHGKTTSKQGSVAWCCMLLYVFACSWHLGPFFLDVLISHFTLYTPHSTLHTPHSTLYTPRSTLHTLHFTLHTLHFSLYFLHSTLYTSHFPPHTLHFTLHTPQSPRHSTHYIPYSTLHFLHAPHFSLHPLHSTVYSALVW